jgi:hypothetical protein
MSEAEDHIPVGVAASIAEIRRLLRVMMFENPPQAEQHMADLPGLNKIRDAASGDYAIATHNPDIYIINDNGTAYTTTILPSHIPEDKVIDFVSPAAGDVLWKRLQELTKALEQRSRYAYEQSRIGESLRSIVYFYDAPLKGPQTRHIDVLKDGGIFLELAGDTEFRAWCRLSYEKLLEAYGWYVLAGTEIVQPLATLILFDLCPLPKEFLLEINRDYLRYTLGDRFKGMRIVMPFPLIDIETYLEHPAIEPNVAVVWATAVARTFQQKADQCRDDAKAKYTIEQFQFGLYLAVLYYRCALYAYKVASSLSKVTKITSDTAKTRIKEGATETVMCEEYRVVIGTSLSVASQGLASGLFPRPSVAKAEEFNMWVEWLITSRFAVEAEKALRESCDAQLLIPTFVRDLALGRIACSTGETKRGLARMLKVLGELEKHLKDAVILGDPNYLSSSYERMAIICEQNGMAKESAEYRRRAEPEYYKLIL